MVQRHSMTQTKTRRKIDFGQQKAKEVEKDVERHKPLASRNGR
jgi:hypothetical protein